MSFIGNFLGKIFGGSVAEPLRVLSDLIKSIAIPKEKAAEANNALAQLYAKHGSIAKARAFLIVICDVCMALVWIPQLLLANYFMIKLSFMTGKLTTLHFDSTKIVELLISALCLTVVHYKK